MKLDRGVCGAANCWAESRERVSLKQVKALSSRHEISSLAAREGAFLLHDDDLLP